MKIVTLSIVVLVALTAHLSTPMAASLPDVVVNNENAELAHPRPTPGLEGYCWPLSAAPGETITFYVSGSGSHLVGLVRAYASAVSRPFRGTTFTPLEQTTNVEAWRNGAGWKPSFTLTIPRTLGSGIYAAELTDLKGTKSYIPFIVKPDPRSFEREVAIIANVNTWLAYNNWGGRSKEVGAAHVSFMRPNPHASPVAALADGGHLLRGELWILSWIEGSGTHKPTVYTDIDFDNGSVPVDYEYLVLSTHPEYWTRRMYENLRKFLAKGGSVLYLGGNGIYENAEYEFTGTNKGMSFRAGAEDGPRETSLFRRLSPPLPERALLGVATERCGVEGGPYEVLQACHPLFRGTGLRDGDLFGERGRNTGYGNGKASGWAIDTSDGPGARGIPRDCDTDTRARPVVPGPGLPSGLTVLARGRNWLEGGSWKGAEMVHYCHPGGGIVFSTGSITFGGSLAVDPKIQQILVNALNPGVAKRLCGLGEGDFGWQLVSTRVTGEQLFRLRLPGLTFDDICPTDWYRFIRLPLYFHDSLGREACQPQISVAFPSGIRITRFEEIGGAAPRELERFTTSPAQIRRIFFNLNELVFLAEPVSSRRTYDLTFEFLVPSERLCRTPGAP